MRQGARDGRPPAEARHRPLFPGGQDAAPKKPRSEIGGTAIQQAPSQATAEAQIEFINNLVSQKVGVIAIAGNDANAVAPALKRAVKQGVRVDLL